MPDTAPAQPHDPYIDAVIEALSAAGLEPTNYWTSAAETDPYRTDDDAGVATMLTAVLQWDSDHDAVNEATSPEGWLLLWDHPAEQWQYAARRAGGGNEEPEFLPGLGLYSDPERVAGAVRALLAGTPFREGNAPAWHEADAARAAVAEWESS